MRDASTFLLLGAERIKCEVILEEHINSGIWIISENSLSCVPIGINAINDRMSSYGFPEPSFRVYLTWCHI